MPKILSWIEITLTVCPELSEACSSIIFEEAGQGSFLDEKPLETQGLIQLKAYLPKDERVRDNLVKLKKRITHLSTYFPDFPPALWNLCLIFEENWSENWKQFFKPLRVSSKIIVCPTWEEYEPQPGECLLRLDPGQAFGTGGHSTTRLCLKALEALADDPQRKPFIFSRVLDVGTGSGILALAAAVYQAESVLAIDNDPLAVEAAQSHVLLNGLDSTIQVELATPETVSGRFSLILANLTLNDLLALAQTFKELLLPEGFLVASGILVSQSRSLVSAFSRGKMVFCGQQIEEEWACVLFQAQAS
ncbi:MAG: 50S ribosomal protein L11 methyltransferase [Pseudomonadota bacterium]